MNKREHELICLNSLPLFGQDRVIRSFLPVKRRELSYNWSRSLWLHLFFFLSINVHLLSWRWKHFWKADSNYCDVPAIHRQRCRHYTCKNIERLKSLSLLVLDGMPQNYLVHTLFTSILSAPIQAQLNWSVSLYYMMDSIANDDMTLLVTIVQKYVCDPVHQKWFLHLLFAAEKLMKFKYALHTSLDDANSYSSNHSLLSGNGFAWVPRSISTTSKTRDWNLPTPYPVIQNIDSSVGHIQKIIFVMLDDYKGKFKILKAHKMCHFVKQEQINKIYKIVLYGRLLEAGFQVDHKIKFDPLNYEIPITDFYGPKCMCSGKHVLIYKTENEEVIKVKILKNVGS